MAVLKLHLDEFDEVNYDLIAIHSVIEDYRLAYFINQNLPILLSKNKDDVEVTVKEGVAYFMKFGYDDLLNDVQWSLFPNQNEIIIKKNNTSQNLFQNSTLEMAQKIYLLPELKKVDFFLKIENNKGLFDSKQIIKSLNKIERIEAVYSVNPEKIKSKNNLIF